MYTTGQSDKKTSFSTLHKSETDFWLDFMDGNEQAFSQLYMYSYPRLYSYGISLGMDTFLAGDAIQDLFLKLYNKPKLIKDVFTIRPFLYRSIRNYYLNVLKKQEHDVDIDELDVSFHLNYTIDEELEEEDERKEIKKKIDRILDQLTSRQREIIYFRFLHEMEYEEISRIMHISGQSARNLLHKTLKKIKEDFFLFFF